MNTKILRVSAILLFVAIFFVTFTACPKKPKSKDDNTGSKTTTQNNSTTKKDVKPTDSSEEIMPKNLDISGVWDVSSVVESDSSSANSPGTERPTAIWHIRVKGNSATIDIEGSEEPITAKINGLKFSALPENTEPWYNINGTIAPEGNFMSGTNKSTFDDNGNIQEAIDSWTAIKRQDPFDEASDGSKPPVNEDQPEPTPEPDRETPSESGSTK